MYRLTLFVVMIALMAASCNRGDNGRDANGTFEAREIIVSSEVMGRIISFNSEEGEKLAKGQEVAVIDGSNLMLQKDQLNASVMAVREKQNDAGPQVAVLQKQIQSARRELEVLEAQASVLQVEQKRIAALFKAEAATQQQKDDVDGKVTVMGKQIEIAKARIDVLNAQVQSAKDVVRIQNKGIISEVQPLQKKGVLIDDQLSRTRVLSPLAGTILTTYVDEGELVSPGKAMFKLADLTEMTLRAYLNGDQLAQVTLGQEVTVYVDSGASEQKIYKGNISWISDKAEFTPKTIQTRDERSNLVYAMKVKVKNDGGIKIGMYGEVDLGVNKDKS